MRMAKKTAITIVTVIVALFIAFTIVQCMMGELFFMAPNYNKMDRYFKANINELSYVVDALSEMNYDSITIRRDPLREEDKYNMKVSREHLVYETVPIPGELVGHIQNLYESGVDVISCSRNSINFTMWSIMDESRGIIYSKTEKVPEGEQLINVKQLSQKNWYYYVHNYEKAKTQKPDLFQDKRGDS